MQTDMVLNAAKEFYALPELAFVTDDRRTEVFDEIDRTGTYAHTYEELVAGARVAWRNHARCIGRMNWRALRVLDFRAASTPDEVAAACWEHLRVSTNHGKLRAVVSVFPPMTPAGDRIRIWNPQLIRYAGHQQPDGTVVGDPLHVEMTEIAQRMGWRGEGTPFDILPLVVDVTGHEPRLYDVPADAILEVPISHPDYPWFVDLGLRWHANPAISNMSLEIGGLSYTAAPFSGWYVSSEIGARNFSDADRYDMLQVVAEKMRLDTSRVNTMWKDRALLELSYAVYTSYRRAGVHIIDHHTAAQQFVNHVDQEHSAGRAVPSQWSWVNPPLSASVTPTFHREYDPPNFELRPNFVYQELPRESRSIAAAHPAGDPLPRCPAHNAIR